MATGEKLLAATAWNPAMDYMCNIPSRGGEVILLFGSPCRNQTASPAVNFFAPDKDRRNEPTTLYTKMDFQAHTCIFWEYLSHFIMILENKSYFFGEAINTVKKCAWCGYVSIYSSCGCQLCRQLRCSNFWGCWSNPMVWPFKWNLFSSTFTWYYFY